MKNKKGITLVSLVIAIAIMIIIVTIVVVSRKDTDETINFIVHFFNILQPLVLRPKLPQHPD